MDQVTTVLENIKAKAALGQSDRGMNAIDLEAASQGDAMWRMRGMACRGPKPKRLQGKCQKF